MNSEMNLFNPVDLDLSRSTFHMTPTHSGTCLAGRLIPAGVWEILPGDSVKMDLRTLVKMSTPVYPTMDQLYMDVFFFFVPNRLVLGARYGNPTVADSNHSWAAIIGAQDNLVNAPLPASGLVVPQVYVGDRVPTSGTLNDYILSTSANFGLHSGGIGINCLPWLTYFAIWSEDFRDESTTIPITWSINNNNYVLPSAKVLLYATKTEVNSARGTSVTSDYKLVNALGINDDPDTSTMGGSRYWLPFPVFRFHGYFGSALPWPQRNAAGVELPLGDYAPVKVEDDRDIGQTAATGMDGLIWRFTSNGNKVTGRTTIGIDSNGDTGAGSSGTFGSNPIVPANLYADLTHATAANVNALRAAIQKQRWYEKLARSGNRYDEFEYGLFGVRPHDSGLMRPLYLGGKRIPLQIEMVASTNGSTTPSTGQGSGSLGALGAFSHTNDQDHMFYHSFDEWGTLMCVFCIRHHDTFSSGVEKMFYRKTREDYYFPTFAHLGEEVLAKKLIGTDPMDDDPFGYQQAWEEYRQFPDKVCGLLRTGENLSFMTYASSFASPTLVSFLNASYQVESIDKTLAVSSIASGFQFIYQFTFDMTMRRCLPTYSIPGLMDHF